jgi:hypothetical protein
MNGLPRSTLDAGAFEESGAGSRESRVGSVGASKPVSITGGSEKDGQRWDLGRDGARTLPREGRHLIVKSEWKR